MTRSDYLAQLDKYLRKLPKDDYDQAMDHFVEYFDEAGPDQEAAVIAELGSPKEAAHDILSNLMDQKTSTSSWRELSLNQTWTLVGLSILAAPMALPLLVVAFTVIVTILVFSLAMLAVLASFVLAALITAGALLWESLTGLTNSFASLSLSLGASLLSFGFGLLFICLTYYFSKLIKLSLLKIGQAFRKGRR